MYVCKYVCMYVCTYVCYWIMRLCVSCTSITWLTVTCSMAFCMKSSCKWQRKCFLSFLCAMILCMQHMHQDVTHVCKSTVTVGSVNATPLHVHGLILIRLFYICYAMLCSMYVQCVHIRRYARGRVHSKQWCAFCWWLSSVATFLLRMCVFT